MEESKLMKRYVVQPSIKLFAGIEVLEDTDFETSSEDGSVRQTMKDRILTTEINREYGDVYKTYEQATLRQEIPVGTILVWSEETGYVIPNYVMVSPEEAAKQLSLVKGVDYDPSEHEEKSPESD